MSVPPFVFFTRDLLSISVEAPVRMLASYSQSCEGSPSPIEIEDFKILGNCNNVLDLTILKSLYINKLKPVSNCDKTAVPLLIANT